MPDQLAGCRAYIVRAEKRLETADAALQEATKQRDLFHEDLANHRKRLQQLEAAAEQPAPQLDVEQTPGAEELTQLRAQLAQAQREAAVLRQENEATIIMGRQVEESLAKAQQQNATMEQTLKNKEGEQLQFKREEEEMKLLGSASLRCRLETIFTEHQQTLLSGD